MRDANLGNSKNSKFGRKKLEIILYISKDLFELIFNSKKKKENAIDSFPIGDERIAKFW